MSSTKLTGLLLVCVVAMILPVQAQKHVHSPPATAGTNTTTPTKLSIPDITVLDQDGQKKKFYTDLVKDRIVVINFVFTSCKAMCPLLGANFSRLQSALGERLGQDVFLISVSTDPEIDSPEKMKTWGEKFKAKAGWTLVTGNKEDLARLLRVFTGDGPSKNYHAPMLCVVNDSKKTHRWAYGFEAPERVIEIVDELKRAVAP
jgi:protein SCO1